MDGGRFANPFARKTQASLARSDSSSAQYAEIAFIERNLMAFSSVFIPPAH